jgi:SAM-dependent methyltransferase
MQKVKRVAERFDEHAKNYDNPWTAWLGERELRAVRQLAPADCPVLDYGCGAGRTTLDLLQRGCRVTAFDISVEMLRLAEAKASLVNDGSTPWRTIEFTTDPARLAGRTWPLVTCIGVMDYCPDPAPMLHALRGYLAPEGRLVITFPNAFSPLSWFYYLGSRITVPATPRTPGFALQACRRAGLTVDEMLFTLPAIRPIGYTMVLRLSASSQSAAEGHSPK